MPKTILLRSLICVVVLLAVLSASHQKASAATILVTTQQDGALGSVAGCSLREAVNAINMQSNGNGCSNSANRPFGTNDEIRFANGVNNITLSLPANPLATASLFIQRPVLIRGQGSTVTTITGGGSALTLIENSSVLRLRSIRLRNAGTGVRNMPDATAQLILVRLTGHSGRAIVNRGRMTMLRVTVSDNPGGGVANANMTPVNFIGGFHNSFGFDSPDCTVACPLNCVSCGGSGGSGSIPPAPAFPSGHAPSGLQILLSVISNNGPVACAGVVNGGGIVAGQPGGVGGIGGNPLAPDEKLEGALTIRRSRIIGNTAGTDKGGGICNQSAALILESEISGNVAGQGGGVAALGLPPGQMAIVTKPTTFIGNSTISSNTASTAGGGVFVETGGGDLNLQFCTITLNASLGTGAAAAGGIAAQLQANVAFRSNALVNNRSAATGVPLQDCANITLNGNFNFWPVTNTGSCSLLGQTNITTGSALLGALAGNGSTFSSSHLPAANSALVDAIPTTNGSCGGIDQRLRTRPRDGNNDQRNGCDIGAIERP